MRACICTTIIAAATTVHAIATLCHVHSSRRGSIVFSTYIIAAHTMTAQNSLKMETMFVRRCFSSHFIDRQHTKYTRSRRCSSNVHVAARNHLRSCAVYAVCVRAVVHLCLSFGFCIWKMPNCGRLRALSLPSGPSQQQQPL